MKILGGVRAAEKLVNQQWEEFEWSSEDEELKSESHVYAGTDDRTLPRLYDQLPGDTMMESMVLGNVWFSQVSLWMSIDRDLKADGVAVKKPFGQLMARTFDSSSSQLRASSNELLFTRETNQCIEPILLCSHRGVVKNAMYC
ncbi:hypothetical protein KRP22_013577 [Phytophthora ramorum]|nr:hypothetical protein KRP22_11248 [Phytophthora ramorum]